MYIKYVHFCVMKTIKITTSEFRRSMKKHLAQDSREQYAIFLPSSSDSESFLVMPEGMSRKHTPEEVDQLVGQIMEENSEVLGRLAK